MEYLDSFHTILDIDYNPIKLNVLVSASDDSTIRFWDLRKQ
jgi:WD40 repeat protein